MHLIIDLSDLLTIQLYFYYKLMATFNAASYKPQIAQIIFTQPEYIYMPHTMWIQMQQLNL